MRAWLTPLLAAPLLYGCGTSNFRPVEYPIRTSLITPFDINGKVALGNAQTSNEYATVYSYGNTTLKGNLSAVTEVMVQQSAKEIEATGRKLGGDGTKIIALRVDSLESENYGPYFKSKMSFQVTLGDGQVLNLSAAHASNSAMSDLNGCISDGVVALLEDDRVRSYLSAELAPPPPPEEPLPPEQPLAPPPAAPGEMPPPGVDGQPAPAPDAPLPPPVVEPGEAPPPAAAVPVVPLPAPVQPDGSVPVVPVPAPPEDAPQ